MAQFDDGGAKILSAPGLNNNRMLKHLDFGGYSNITQSEWQAIFASLQMPFFSLENLYLWGNDVNDAALLSLSSALRHSTTLKILQLDGIISTRVERDSANPVERHVAAGEHVLGSGGDHQFVGDWDSRIDGKDLALLLFACVNSQWEAGVDADVELGHVVVQVGLADLGVRCQDVLDQRVEVDAVESFRRIIEDGVVNVVECGGKLVSSDGKEEVVGSPCFARGDVDGTQFSRCWMVAPFGLTGYVGGSAAGIVNAAPFRAK
jgi:hypothetical protein